MSDENSSRPQKRRLTPAQVRFFQSYIEEFPEDILPRSMEGKTEAEIAAARDRFLASNANSDFDGAATPAEIRVAKNLLAEGYLTEVDEHSNVVTRNLYVVFSTKGLEALFNVATTMPLPQVVATVGLSP